MTRSDLALAALASAAVPGMKPVSVRGVRPDQDQPAPRHQVALVEDATGRTWVVRVPLDPAAGAELERNDALVRMLGRHLPFKVPAAAGYASVGQDGRAAVFPYVEGRALALRQLPPGAGLAGAVGRAVAAVHNIPRGLFEEMGVPVFDAATVRGRRLAVLDRAAETGHVPTGLLARWEQALEAAPLWHFATTPVHGSLDGSSFLVAFTEDDAATGRVVAMTGWEHAAVADPAEDFASLVDQASYRAVDSVVESYALARSQRPDPHIVQRARLAAEMRLLEGLAAAAAAGDDSFVRSRADRLRKLDRLTSADDSLVPRTAMVAAPPSPTAYRDPSADASVASSPGPEAGTPDAPDLPTEDSALPPEYPSRDAQAPVAVAESQTGPLEDEPTADLTVEIPREGSPGTAPDTSRDDETTGGPEEPDATDDDPADPAGEAAAAVQDRTSEEAPGAGQGRASEEATGAGQDRTPADPTDPVQETVEEAPAPFADTAESDVELARQETERLQTFYDMPDDIAVARTDGPLDDASGVEDPSAAVPGVGQDGEHEGAEDEGTEDEDVEDEDADTEDPGPARG